MRQADSIRNDPALSAYGPVPIGGIQLADGDNGLRATIDTEFLEYRRYVSLDRRLRDTELEGNLLVEKALAQHEQDTHLLRCQG